MIDIRDFGAAPGSRLSTSAIQQAVVTAYNNGGGTVHVPPGTFTVTSVCLLDNVTLHLADGALLGASSEASDYVRRGPVIQAREASCIALTGPGTVDGGGAHFYPDPATLPPRSVQRVCKPKPLRGRNAFHTVHFDCCSDVLIDGVTLRDSVAWTCRLTACRDVVVRGITIRNPPLADRCNTDGIDLVSCCNVLVEDCDIVAGDDAVVLKTLPPPEASPAQTSEIKNVTVRNCVVASTCNATKIGTETVGDIHDVLFENIRVKRHPGAQRNGRNPQVSGNAVAAISIQSNDGAAVGNITCRNYRIDECATPFFILLQDRESLFPHAAAGRIANVHLENIICRHAETASQINVCRNAAIENVTLRDVDIHNMESCKGTVLPATPDGSGYPDANRYGAMPAFGLFARRVRALHMAGNIAFHDDGGSGRPAIVFDQVSDVSDASSDKVLQEVMDIGSSSKQRPEDQR